ncbi:hypothetical protein LCGC14_3023220, partial [marine sediment metagenome]
ITTDVALQGNAQQSTMIGLSSIGSELNIISRVVSVSEVSVNIIDDKDSVTGIREIVGGLGGPLYGQQLQVLLGERTIAEAVYLSRFNGIIQDWVPIEGGVTITAQDARTFLRDRKLRHRDIVTSTNIANRHPLQLIQLIFIKAGVPNSMINFASLDPDLQSTGARANSHFNIARGVHGPYDRSIHEPESALGMIDELAQLLGGAVIINSAGEFEYVPFDPSASADENLTDEDILEFRQLSTTEDTFNSILVHAGWKGTVEGEGFEEQMESGKWKPIGWGSNDFLYTLQRTDSDSLTDYAFPGETNRFQEASIKTKWTGIQSYLAFPHDASGTQMQLEGGWLSGFCGVDRIVSNISDGTVN